MQEIIVYGVVFLAAWVVLKRYAPQSMRRMCRSMMARDSVQQCQSEEKAMTENFQGNLSTNPCATCRGCELGSVNLEKRIIIVSDNLMRRNAGS